MLSIRDDAELVLAWLFCKAEAYGLRDLTRSVGGVRRCPLCKAEQPRLVITRWRARGESFEQMLARERTALWEQPQWASGVLVDKLAPAPPGSDWGPLPAVLRARPQSLCKDQGRSACCLPGGWPGGQQPRWVLGTVINEPRPSAS